MMPNYSLKMILPAVCILILNSCASDNRIDKKETIQIGIKPINSQIEEKMINSLKEYQLPDFKIEKNDSILNISFSGSFEKEVIKNIFKNKEGIEYRAGYDIYSYTHLLKMMSDDLNENKLFDSSKIFKQKLYNSPVLGPFTRTEKNKTSKYIASEDYINNKPDEIQIKWESECSINDTSYLYFLINEYSISRMQEYLTSIRFVSHKKFPDKRNEGNMDNFEKYSSVGINFNYDENGSKILLDFINTKDVEYLCLKINSKITISARILTQFNKAPTDLGFHSKKLMIDFYKHLLFSEYCGSFEVISLEIIS